MAGATPKEIRDALESAAGRAVREDVRLSDHTSFAIGGPAAIFLEVGTVDALGKALRAAARFGLQTLILGGGTNLLASDQGFDGLVIKPALDRLEIDREKRVVRVGASVPTAVLVEALIAEGLGGLQFAAGLPGTVGGAIAGNAGCFGRSLGDQLANARIADGSGPPREIAGAGWFDFAYRHSKLLESGLVLCEAAFAVAPEDPVRLREESAKYIGVRAEKHPPKGARTAGSYFKNLPPRAEGEPRQAAGALLDQVGAKALSVGDAAVFPRHANIIVNRGNAKAADVLSLAAEMKRRVLDRFGVTLEEEVRFVGPRPEGLQ